MEKLLRMICKFPDKGAYDMKKNRWAMLLLSAVLILGLFSGCGSVNRDQTGQERLSIVATVFPEYDWVRQILGDRADQVDLTLLLDTGADLHSYQPTTKDIVTISGCDLFIYVGGTSDQWAEDILAQAANPDMQVLNLMECLGAGAKEEEVVEGMQDDEAEPEEGPEYDEHVWLSLKNAELLCVRIRDALCSLDPANQAVYTANTEAYIARLRKLDEAYQAAVDKAQVKTLVFADRFPFRYLTDDYGLDYYAAFAGCSAETEASFETIAFLSAKVEELGLHAILQIESADGSVARTVRDNTASKDQEILTLNSMQAVTKSAADEGADYLEIMEQNLEVLKQAIGT